MCVAILFEKIMHDNDCSGGLRLTLEANWRPAEDMGNHDQSRPGNPPRNASLRLRTMEKGLDEYIVSSHRAVRPRSGQLNW